MTGRDWLRTAIAVTAVKQRHSKLIRRYKRGKEVPVDLPRASDDIEPAGQQRKRNWL